MLPKKMPTKVATRPPKPPTSKSREAGTEEKFRAAIGKAAEGLTALVEKGRAEAVAKASRPKKPDVRQPEGRKRSKFTEVGDEAKAVAQRALLLETLDANGWNLTATAEDLGMGAATAVSRALRELAPKEYEKAKRDGRVSQGNRRAE